ncbi:MAG TPA: hypothetical protein VFL76_09335 [Edaphocola sp.]|nr:hypothetical protein [Edaphocola sp.]
MRNLYSRLIIPVLFAFVACSASQPDKSPVIPETRDTIKAAVDYRGSEQVATIKRGTARLQKQKNIKADTLEKATAKKSRLPDLPQPPHFENEEVDKGVQDFAHMIKENIIAEQNHDSVKMAVLKKKMSSLPADMTIWIFKMSSDERQSFRAYLKKIEKIAKQE